MNKETFLENFSKIYQYPYGTSFLKGKEKVDDSDFERYLKRKQHFNPFHVDWPKTKNLICYWDKNKVTISLIPSFKDTVFRLQNYYEGYDDSKENIMKKKLEFEKERFMNASHPEFTRTYDLYLKYIEEKDIIEYESQLKSDRKNWVGCQKHYYGNPFEKLGASNAKNLPHFCEQWAKKAVGGNLESGSVDKKIAKFLENPIENAPKYKISEETPPSAHSNSGDKEKVSSKGQNSSNGNKKRKRIHTTNSKTVKRQKTKGNSSQRELIWKSCFTKILYDQKQHTFNYDLVHKLGWICINCKSCLTCQPTNLLSKDAVKNESQLLICDNCDRTYHTYCLNPPLADVPATVWNWEDCLKMKSLKKICQGCQKALLTKENHTFKGFPVCKNCLKQFKEGEYWQLWMWLYNENKTNRNFVFCDFCEKWIHSDCDGINKEKLNEMEKSTQKYKCPLCRNKSSSK